MFSIGKRFGYRVFEWKWMAKIMHAERLEMVKDKLSGRSHALALLGLDPAESVRSQCPDTTCSVEKLGFDLRFPVIIDPGPSFESRSGSRVSGEMAQERR